MISSSTGVPWRCQVSREVAKVVWDMGYLKDIHWFSQWLGKVTLWSKWEIGGWPTRQAGARQRCYICWMYQDRSTHSCIWSVTMKLLDCGSLSAGSDTQMWGDCKWLPDSAFYPFYPSKLEALKSRCLPPGKNQWVHCQMVNGVDLAFLCQVRWMENRWDPGASCWHSKIKASRTYLGHMLAVNFTWSCCKHSDFLKIVSWQSVARLEGSF